MLIVLRISEAEVLYSLITGEPQGHSSTDRRGIRRMVSSVKECRLSLANRDLFLLLEAKLRQAITHARAVHSEKIGIGVENEVVLDDAG